MAVDPVGGLAWRETRRGGLIVVASLVGLIAAFGAAYSAAAVGSNGTGSFAAFTDNPMVRALYGVPYALDTQGGFVVWRCTIMIPTLVALWASMTSTRVLRGEEDAGRWDLVLAEPVSRTDATASHLAVLTLWCVAVGVAVAVTFVAGGDAAEGSALYGTAIGLLAWTFVSVGTCASQVFGNRRLANGTSAALIGGAMLLRMAADSSADREWMRWLTPFGWVERVQPFGANDVAALVPLFVAPFVLGAIAAAMMRARDVGDGLLQTSDSSEPKTRLLTSPGRFAWRQRVGGLVGWSAGMVVFGLVIGAITAAGVTFIAANPEIDKAVSELGFTGLSTPQGFVASCTPLVAVALVFYAASSLGHCFEDEETERLHIPYAHPVTRTTWLRAQVVAAAAAAIVAAAASIVATWAGGLLGNAGLSLSDIAIATLNVLPGTALFFGFAVLLFGVRPHLTVSVAAGAAVALYMVSFIGPALDWPQWVLDLNPFLQLGNAPVADVNWTAILLLLGLAGAATATGFVTYRRRDLA